jgi:hypothetical protein
MALEVGTMGTQIYYAVEQTSGTRPTTLSAYTVLTNIKSVPSFNPEPESLEVTDLADTEWKRYIPGLRDVGGSLAFTANLTQAFLDAWDTTLVPAAETAKLANKATWFMIVVPGITKAFYFTGVPAPLGLPEMAVNTVLEADAYITPNYFGGYLPKAA